MPLREFECEGCGKTFEALIRHPEEEREVDCPACGKRRIRRLLSAPAAASKEGKGTSCGGRSGFT